jgi:hypothetical protein
VLERIAQCSNPNSACLSGVAAGAGAGRSVAAFDEPAAVLSPVGALAATFVVLPSCAEVSAAAIVLGLDPEESSTTIATPPPRWLGAWARPGAGVGE